MADAHVGGAEERLSSIGGTALTLFVSRTSTIALGAIAWLLATRFLSVEVIGQNAAIVGICTFVASASLLGFDQTVVRYASGADSRTKSEMITGALFASPLIAFALGALAVPLALEPTLPVAPVAVLASWLAISATAAVLSAAAMGEAGLLAVGRPRAILTTNLVIALGRLALIGGVVFTSAPFYSAFLVSWAAGAVVAVWFLRPNVGLSRRAARVGISRLRRMIGYSLTSYLATTLDVAALSLLPVLILRLTDAATAGVFQVVWLISLSLYAIPGSVARAAFASQSRSAASREMRGRLASISIGGGTALAGVVILAASWVLGLVGPDYVKGAGALAWFAAIIPVGAYSSLRVTDIRLSGEMKWLVLASLAQLLVLLSGVAVLLPSSGLAGVGFAWFLSQSVFAAMVSALFAKHARTLIAVPRPGR